jgi:hypothetical protein
VSLWRGYISIEVERRDNTFTFLIGALLSAWFWLLVFARLWDCFQPWNCLPSWSSHGNQRLPFKIARRRDWAREVGIEEEGSLSKEQPLIKLN